MSTKQKQTDGTGARKRDGLWMIPGCLGMVVLNAA
ncbi:conjugal transfer protein TrbI, partial [Salmonella enterica subsp. enterica serovar Typhimurium]